MATYANMGSHTMKTTIEISDDLFARTQEVARKEKTTLRSLTERGLRLVLEEKLTRSSRNRQWLQTPKLDLNNKDAKTPRMS